MSKSNSLINLGDLATPANTLIEKISDAIGGIFRPYQIRRIAEAESDAEKIRATSQVEITELQRRAVIRFIAEEAKKQNNIEAIARRALPEVGPQAQPENVENDWIVNFFDKCRLISDEQMQGLWARILAGEANSPGRFSKRTVDCVAQLDKVDAGLFSNVCSFAFVIGEITPLIYNSGHPTYTNAGLNFSSLSHLESIGLVHFSEIAGYVRQGLPQKNSVAYFGRRVWLEFPNAENTNLQVGRVLLTQVGRQLAPICMAHPVEGFVDYVREVWKNFGYQIDLEALSTPA